MYNELWIFSHFRRGCYMSSKLIVILLQNSNNFLCWCQLYSFCLCVPFSWTFSWAHYPLPTRHLSVSFFLPSNSVFGTVTFFVCVMKISIVVSYRCLCNFPLTFLLPLSTPPFTFSSSFCPRHWLIYAEDRNGAEDRVSVSLSRQHAETSVGLLKPNLRNCRKYHFPQKTDIRRKLHRVQ